MPPRDRVREILEIDRRSARHILSSAKLDLDSLADAWQSHLKQVVIADELVPTRIVTILEVFVRSWIAKLVNEGSPYVERAAKLSTRLKFDFAIASSLHGRVVTLGQLVAHGVSINSIESIGGVFGELLNEDLFLAISKVHDRWSVEIEGKPELPIIADVNLLKANLARLFDVRHILVHEMPRKKPHTKGDVDDFLLAAMLFVQAVDEMLTVRLHGKYPLTQLEMNMEAATRSATADDELAEICNQIVLEDNSSTIPQVQDEWRQFAKAEAQRQADMVKGGSMERMMYSSALEALTRTRIDELKKWMEEGKFEGE